MTPHQPLNVVVLTCSTLGLDVAAKVREITGVGAVTVVRAPYREPRRSAARKIRHLYRMQGLPGFLAILRRRLQTARMRYAGAHSAHAAHQEIAVLEVDDFHDPRCIAALHDLSPDLGVIAGTYILGEAVFSIPRMGSINLHSGKAPEYRGAAPGFWELFNGESSVGITIHRVTARLDEGSILVQEMFPLDPAPARDPIEYLDWYRDTVLRPNGIRLAGEAVQGLIAGSLTERPQDPCAGRTYRSPDYRAVQELRRRVKARRTCGVL